jgi:anaerobic selenocysteine-containing dehydrogenase
MVTSTSPRSTHKSICRFCHAYCGIEVDVENGDAVAVRGDRDHPISRGFTCEKGRQIPQQHRYPGRLRSALRRSRDGGFEPIATEQAMDEIAERLGDIVAEHGPRSVALYNGTKSWQNVSFGVARSWLQGIGSPSMYTTVTIDQPYRPLATALHGSWSGGLQRISDADVTLFVGTNPLASFLPPGIKLPCADTLRYLREYLARGLQLIVIDPRRTETARYATRHLQVRPGQDAPLLAGMIRLIVDRELFDRAFVEAHTTGLDRLRRAIEPFDLDEVERRTGVRRRDVEGAARFFAEAERGSAVGGTGPNMAAHPLSTEMLISSLNSLCGRWAREGDRVNHAGVLGAPNTPRAEVIPPYDALNLIEQPRIRGLHSFFWELPTPALADEILTAGDGQVRALICNGGNPAVAFPDQAKVVRALQALDLLVCTDVIMTPTTRLAHYVFGCKLMLEEPDYTRHLEFYFPEPFAQYTPAILDVDDDIIDEWELFWGLAHRMRVPLELGRSPMGPPVAGRTVDIDVKPTTDELLDLEAADARIPLDVVKQHPGGAVFEEAMTTVGPGRSGATARLDFAPREFLDDLARCADDRTGRPGGADEYPYLLTSRRMRHVFNSTGVHLDALNQHGPGNPAFLHPLDMSSIGIQDGDLVEIASATGRIVGMAKPDPDLLRGVVSMSHSWGVLPGEQAGDPSVGACTNLLVSSDVEYEPLIGQCRQSAVPVTVRACVTHEKSGSPDPE